MSNPWNGQRHRSWASDTIIVGFVFLVVLIVTVVIDSTNGPDPAPPYLTGLLGAAGAAFFAAAGADKNKREAEIADDARIAKNRASSINETAIRAEAKADKLAEFARSEHPDHQDDLFDGGSS